MIALQKRWMLTGIRRRVSIADLERGPQITRAAHVARSFTHVSAEDRAGWSVDSQYFATDQHVSSLKRFRATLPSSFDVHSNAKQHKVLIVAYGGLRM